MFFNQIEEYFKSCFKKKITVSIENTKDKNLYLRNTFYTHIYLAWWVELIEG